MSTDLRAQSQILADYFTPRLQREALLEAEEALRRALESQPPAVCAELVDAVRAPLAQSHLNREQRAALVSGISTRLGALLEPAAPRQLFAVGDQP